MIRDFYRHRSILLTGVPGFVGKGVLAKVMADLPEVARIYVLSRQRHRADGSVVEAAERLEAECFATSLFDRFRSTDPDGFAAAREKVVPITGDITKDELGCDAEIYARLLDDVDLIIANAATVEFDAPLDFSLDLNTLGPQRLLEFARACRRDAVMVQVSTAYVNGQLPGLLVERPLPINRTIRQMIDEAPTSFDPDREVEACKGACERIRRTAASEAQREAFRREILDQGKGRQPTPKRVEKLVDDRCNNWLKRELVREGMERARAYGWHDVYTFTKGMGEQLLVKHQGDVPLVIVRPSVIESSLKDPEPGWISGLKVSDPLIVAYGRGLVPDFPAARDSVMDLIPVDIVVNGILAAAGRAAESIGGEVPVFHIASGSENPITNNQLFRLMKNYFHESPMRGRNGEIPELPEWSFPSQKRFRTLFNLKYMYPLDAVQWLVRKLPNRLVPGSRRRALVALRTRLQRVLYYTDLFSPYTHLESRFQTTRGRDLFESLPPEERAVFDMDVTRIDWPEYYARIHLPGLRRHVLKEEVDADPLLQQAPEEAGAAETRWHDEEQIKTIPDLVAIACARHGERLAFQIERGGRWQRYTYAEAAEQIERRLRLLERAGLGAEDRVLLLGHNSPEWVFSCCGCLALGATAVPLDPQTSPEHVWDLADFATARAVIADAGLLRQLERARPDGRAREVTLLDVQATGQALGEVTERESRISPEMTATVIFTAGPAIEPRGVCLTHGNLIANLLALAEVQQVDASDRILSTLPLHHALEFTGGLLMSMLAGATTTYLESVNSRSILEAIRATGTTAMMGVPRLYKLLSDRVRRLECAADLSNLRLVVSGGAPLSAELSAVYRDFGIVICEGYGLSEAGPVVSVNPPDVLRAGSVGQPLPGQEVRIEGGEQGEVLVRGANVTPGYLNRPDLTAVAIADGWLRTGDRGYLDGDGFLYITGHSDHIILTGVGKNVYAEEVEAHYWGLPHVAELGVVGIRSDRTQGEEIHGALVLRSEDGGEQLVGRQGEVRERLKLLARLLPTYARIQHLHFRSRSLPRDHEGTLDRTALGGELALTLTQGLESEAGGPALDRFLCQQAGRIAGLSRTEVAAHFNVPIDTFLDSLMTIEFRACLQERLQIAVPAIDRGRQSLRDLADGMQSLPGVQLEQEDLEAGQERPGQFWNRLLAGERAHPVTARSLGRRVIQSAFWTPGRTILRSFYKFSASGVEHLPQDRPYLIVANYASYLDVPAVYMAVRRHVDVLNFSASSSYFRQSRATAWFMRKVINAIPLDSSDECAACLDRIGALLGPRRPLLVFPEGGRSPSEQLQPFKSGVGLLALELDVPIVPLHITGTLGRWGRHQSTARRSRGNPIRLLFGQPLEMRSFRVRDDASRYETYRLIAEQAKQQIVILSRVNGVAGAALES